MQKGLRTFNYWRLKCTVVGKNVNNTKGRSTTSLSSTLSPLPSINRNKQIWNFFVYFMPPDKKIQKKNHFEMNILSGVPKQCLPLSSK